MFALFVYILINLIRKTCILNHTSGIFSKMSNFGPVPIGDHDICYLVLMPYWKTLKMESNVTFAALFLAFFFHIATFFVCPLPCVQCSDQFHNFLHQQGHDSWVVWRKISSQPFLGLILPKKEWDVLWQQSFWNPTNQLLPLPNNKVHGHSLMLHQWHW